MRVAAPTVKKCSVNSTRCLPGPTMMPAMGIHDPTTIAPARFVASVLVEAACDYVCKLPFGGGVLKTIFDRTLRARDDGATSGVFGELARALAAEGYFHEPPWRNKLEMIEFVERVAARLRS